MKLRGLQRLCVAAVARLPQPSTVRFLCSGTTQSSLDAALNTITSSPPPPPSSSPETGTTTSAAEHRGSVTDPAGPVESAPPAQDSGSTAEQASQASDKKQKPFWTIFKAALAGATVVATVGSGYASYSYTSDQISDKISSLKNSEGRSSGNDGSLLQSVEDALHSTSTKALASIAELYLEIRKAVEGQIRGFAAPTSDKLLPDLLPQEKHVFTIVLDLNETLVYSDWKRDRGWRTFKRPGVEAFLEHLAQYYELVVYTDQLPFVVDPILEKLDQKGCIRYRLAREATHYVNGKHYRDLSKLNRNPARILYVSAHAAESCLQPENGVPVKPWKLENDDTMLLDLLPFFEYVARHRPTDIRPVLASYSGQDIPSEFRERTKEYQRKMREMKFQNPFFKGSKSSQL